MLRNLILSTAMAKIKMTLFNQENIPPVILDGQDIMPGHRKDNPIGVFKL